MKLIKLRIYVIEFISILLIPIVLLIIMNSTTLTHVILMHVVIGGLLSFCYVNCKENDQFGELLYERSNRSGNKCFLKVVLFELGLFAFNIVSSQFGARSEDLLIIYTLLNTLFLVILLRSEISVQLYTKGLLYKGKFYTNDMLSSAHIVKDYKGNYELILSEKVAKIILNKEELKIVKAAVE